MRICIYVRYVFVYTWDTYLFTREICIFINVICIFACTWYTWYICVYDYDNVMCITYTRYVFLLCILHKPDTCFCVHIKWFVCIENGGKVAEMWILCRSIDSVARGLGGPWTWWIGSAPVQMSGCCLGASLSWLCDGLLAGVGCSSLILRFSWTVTLIILFCVLAYCGSVAPLLSLQSFYNYAKGHCEAARSFFRAMHSVHLIRVEQ